MIEKPYDAEEADKFIWELWKPFRDAIDDKMAAVRNIVEEAEARKLQKQLDYARRYLEVIDPSTTTFRGIKLDHFSYKELQQLATLAMQHTKF